MLQIFRRVNTVRQSVVGGTIRRCSPSQWAPVAGMFTDVRTSARLGPSRFLSSRSLPPSSSRGAKEGSDVLIHEAEDIDALGADSLAGPSDLGGEGLRVRHPEEVAEFAKLAAEDIVARCRAREINYVSIILKKVLDKPQRRHELLKKRTAKWVKEYDWLVIWLTGLLDGDMRRISHPMDDLAVKNKLVDAIRVCYTQRLDNLYQRSGTELTFNTPTVPIVHSSGLIDMPNLNATQLRQRLYELGNEICAELTPMSVLKLAAIVSKYSREGRVAHTSTHDKRFRDGQFRKDIQLHLCVNAAVSHDLLRFLGVYIPADFEAKNMGYLERRGPKREQIESLLVKLVTQLPMQLAVEERTITKKREQWEEKIMDDILDARTALAGKPGEVETLSGEVPASVYMAKVRKRAKRYMSSSMCHQVELFCTYNSGTSLTLLEDSAYMPWNYASPATLGLNDQDNGYEDQNEDKDYTRDSEGAIVSTEDGDAPQDLGNADDTDMPSSSALKIFMGNLPLDADALSIANALQGCGPVERVQIHTDDAMVAEQKEALALLEQREEELAAKIAEAVAVKRRRRRKTDDYGQPIELTEEEQAQEDEERAKAVATRASEVDRHMKREIKSLRGLRAKAIHKTTTIAKSVRSDTHAFVTLATEEGYEAAIRPDIQIFGVHVKDPVTNMSRLSRCKPAHSMRVLFVEVRTSEAMHEKNKEGGKSYNPSNLMMKHIQPDLQAALGDEFKLSSGDVNLNGKKPFYILLRCPDHETAWRAYRRLRNAAAEREDREEQSSLVLSPHWVGNRNYVQTKNKLSQRRKLDDELAGQVINEKDLLHASSQDVEQLLGAARSDTGSVPVMHKREGMFRANLSDAAYEDDEDMPYVNPHTIKGSSYDDDDTSSNLEFLDNVGLDMDLNDGDGDDEDEDAYV